MSDSNRLLIAAAALGLIFCAIVWGAIGVGSLLHRAESPYTHSHIEPYGEYHEPLPEPSAVALQNQACADAASTTGDQTQRREDRDLCAQYIAAAGARKAADYSVVQTWIGIVGLFAVIVTLVLNYVATIAATEQSKIARHAFEEAERPLFFVSIVEPDYTRRRRPKAATPSLAERLEDAETRERRAKSLVLYIEFHNVGTRPAFGVSLSKVIGFPKNKRGRITTQGMAEFAPGEKYKEFISYFSKDAPISARIMAGERLQISGLLVYDDTLGIRRERAFMFVAKRRQRIVALLDDKIVWERVNDPRFNFDRRVEPQST